MKYARLSTFLLLLAPVFAPQSDAQPAPVVEDGGVAISADELSYNVSKWTPQMREVAIKDPGDRLELLNLALTNKRLAAEADNYIAEHPGLKWEYLAGIESYKRNFLLVQYRDSLEYPDFSDLAREQYEVKTRKYALVPERRTSSHILFASPPGRSREDLLVKAQAVLDELRAGADFEELVAEYSGEPGAAEKKGKFDKWITYGEQGVSPPYSEGLFTIEKTGEYAELVQTQFGVHIIRLDGIQEESYKSFEEVKPEIVESLKAEYTQLAMKEFVARFHMSEEVAIDDAAVEAVLKPYRKPE